MPNKKYERGYAFENKLVRYLLDCGWYATRSAGSHTVADVIGIPPNGRTYLFQCKTNKKEIVLTDLFNDVKVFQLRKINEAVRKIIAIRVGTGRDYITKFYECIKLDTYEYEWKETTEFADI
jgi:Holliday junction resolvase